MLEKTGGGGGGVRGRRCWLDSREEESKGVYLSGLVSQVGDGREGGEVSGGERERPGLSL